MKKYLLTISLNPPEYCSFDCCSECKNVFVDDGNSDKKCMFCTMEILDDDWIKLEDEMPPENKLVKIKSETLWKGKAVFKDGKFDFQEIKGACFGEPTHWMPIPRNEK